MATDFISKASLVLIPSGFKAGTLYSYKPDDGTGDFTFVRNSGASRVNEAGNIVTMQADVPRLNYPACPSLLLEPARSNVLLYSEDFTQSNWIKASTVVEANSIQSPDGLMNGTKITADSPTTFARVIQQYTTEVGITGGFSVYLKAGNITNVSIQKTNNNEFVNVVLTDEWQRFYVSSENSSTIVASQIYLNEDANNGTANDGDYIYAWGAQLEGGTYPTSYIKTEAATVSRSGDVTSLDTNGLLGATEGTWFIEFGETQQPNSDSNARFYVINGSSQRMGIALNASGAIRIRVNAVNVTYTGTLLTNSKIALRYSATGFKFFYNGVKIDSGTLDGQIYTAPTTFNATQAVGQTYNVKQMLMFDTALTDEELIKLTT